MVMSTRRRTLPWKGCLTRICVELRLATSSQATNRGESNVPASAGRHRRRRAGRALRRRRLTEEGGMSQPLRVAIVGAGPAGIYAADILPTKDPEATVDIFDRLPTPYGLIRYGVAPDHPRIKQIIVALHRVMENERIRFIGNVHVGVDLKVDELRQFYDAIIFATGAERDRSMRIPGEELVRSHGAADFVAFYDSHPDREQTWDLSGQRSVAVVGVGNVGLDVARMLARGAA